MPLGPSDWIKKLVDTKPAPVAPKLGVPPVVAPLVEEVKKEEVKPVVPVTPAVTPAPAAVATPTPPSLGK